MKYLIDEYLKWEEQKKIDEEEMEEYFNDVNMIDEILHENAGDRD